MAAAPVNPSSRPRPGWKLADPLQERTQGLVATGFGHLPHGRALLLRFAWPADRRGGGWLEPLRQVVEIQDGVPDKGQDRAAAIAFTGTGLAYMGLGEQALASFSRPFREGMFQEDRMRRLGDRRGGKWLESVIAQGPVWSANTPGRDPAPGCSDSRSAYAVPDAGPAEESISTPVTVHALLLLYTRTEADAASWTEQVGPVLADCGVEIARSLDLLLDVIGDEKFSREHFGFADGLSQPLPYGLSAPKDESRLVTLAGAPAPRHPVHGIPLGEILIGYQNGHSEPAPGPVVARRIGADLDDSDPRPGEAGLPAHPLAEGFADLGIDGSYLVVRELRQDVAAFWNSLEANAARIRADDPSAEHVTAEWIAERVIGRDRDGNLLCPAGKLAATDSGPANDFLFRQKDPHGAGCPPGSHVRRGNPRDALAPHDDAASRETLLQAANNHRILRRGRKFGTRIADPKSDDGAHRGLLFMCLNTDIARQFEFVQQTWLLNSTFATLFGEVDPLLGPAGPMTIREQPLRRTIQVQTYVQFVGGDYFFLPSMAALRYLALL